MADLSFCEMTQNLCRAYFRAFENDPSIYMDMQTYHPYQYSDEKADAYFDRQAEKKRLHFAIMERNAPIGEILLKNINLLQKECTLSIHLQNDSAKGRGIGTASVQWMLRYAFEYLDMNTVFADTVLKNMRSAHVLEKVGFQLIRQDTMFRYYAIFCKDYAKTTMSHSSTP